MTKNTEVMEQRAGNGAPEDVAVPAADIFETPDAYVVILDLPGASKDSIAVTLEKHELSVRATIAPRYTEPASVLFSELHATGYERSFNLGDGIDRDSVDAKFEQGVLTVKLFKSEELKPREIAIH